MVYLALAILAILTGVVAATAGFLELWILEHRIDDLETVIAAMHHNPTLWPPHPDTHTHEQEPTP
jgi:hypothetical protein